MALLENFFSEMYDSYPTPGYNLIRLSETDILLEMNVAGISEESIDVELSGNRLKVQVKVESDERQYFHKGIHTKSFQRSFVLKDDLVVKSACVKNGILSIHLEHQIPEEKKPRKILLSH